MQNDRAPVPAQETAPIQVPDQLQQARRSDMPRAGEAPADRDSSAAGILHELKTDRAHD